jgi:hypothetical protein
MNAKRQFYGLLTAGLLCVSSAATAQVYKWVDENGKVHYSDKKPPNSENKAVEELTEEELNTYNIDASGDDGVDVERLKKDRERRENQRASEQERRLVQEAEAFRGKNCSSGVEDVRRGNAGGGTRVVGTREFKRCQVPIPPSLQPYLQGYTYEGSESQ